MATPTSGNLRPVRTPVPSEDPSSQALSEALGSSFLLVRILVFLLLGAFLFSCVFTVDPNEVAVVLRFGKPRGLGTEQIRRQGLHFALPYPVDEIVKVRIGESKTVRTTNSWFAISPEDEAAGIMPMALPSLTPGLDGHVLTADGNILHVRTTLRYRITDPVAYAFQFGNVTNLLVNVLDNAVHWASVRTTADGALRDRSAFRDAIRSRTVSLIERVGIGITADTLDVEVAAPLFVKDAFDLVISAEQDRSKQINEAQGEADRVVREAEGEAQRILSGGMTSSNSLVQGVLADARFFEDQLPYYRRNPRLYRDRLRVEAIARVLTNAQDKFYQPDRIAELRLNLSREPQVPATAQPDSGR